jgi:hypothetical protein
MTDDHDDHGIQTRIVSRVLLIVGLSFSLKKAFSPTWLTLLQLEVIDAQSTGFKPTSDTTNSSDQCRLNQFRLPIVPRQLIKWAAIVDFVVSCLFLGIPYIL